MGAQLKVVIVGHSPNPERTVAMAGRLCYSPIGIAEIDQNFTEGQVSQLIKKLVSMGHFSALEHASFTFGVEGISRAASHQLVRHRVASYSQQSQRYVKFDEVEAVIPPSIASHPSYCAEFEEKLVDLWAFYSKLTAGGIPAEDARFILPNAAETKIVITMNARELYHFFSHRCCNRAQWEIRALAKEMLKQVRAIAPLLFAEAGPGCISGACPEGAYTCGNAALVREEFKEASNV